MAYRIYYWFAGTDPHRIGGPWWYQDFNTKKERHGFLSAMRTFLYKYAVVEDKLLIHHDKMKIKPPMSTAILGD